MIGSGLAAELQAAAPDGGATLTLGSYGLIALAALLLVAASGWIFFALLRSRRSSTPAAVAAEPREDPLESTFRAAEPSLADGVFLCRDGLITRAAGSHAGLLGPDAGRFVGRPLTSLTAAADVLVLSETLHDLTRGAASTLEVGFTFDPGGDLPARDVSAKFVAPPDAPPSSFVAILSDISGPAGMARVASGIAARVEAALALHPDGILVTLHEAGREKVLLATPPLEPILGLSPGWLLGRPLEDLRGRLRDRFREQAIEALLAESPTSVPEIVETGGEEPRLIARTSRSLGPHDGPGGRLLVFRDLTAERARLDELQRAAEEASGAREALERQHDHLLLANEGLERRIADFVRFNREMKVLDEMKSNLLANVSHELQTPLVSIRGYTEMMLKGRLGPTTEEQERGLQVALRSVDRLIALIDGLLAFVRAEKESAPLRIEVFSLKALVEEVLHLIKEQAGEKGIAISTRFPSGDLAVKADRARIAQVFINLLGNAVKYNRDGGSVDVEAARGQRSTARVEIRDTGIGIPRDALDKIFERFYRGGVGDGEGSGLGLAITKDILRLHGCMIRADSEPGKGSTFSFTLPLETRGKPDRSPRLSAPERQEA
jgi:signal transduction histidine kinase